MSKMSLKVEFLAGTGIREAVVEAKQKALEFDVAYICFNFNGVNFSIGRGADIDRVITSWDFGDTKYGIVSA